jgi:hypothetical protein
MQGASLRRAFLRGVRLGRRRIEGDTREFALTIVPLHLEELAGPILRGAVLAEADLRGAYLLGAQLQGANLNSASLEGADLEAARLQGADLRYAKMEGALLTGADLRGASLENGRLQGAGFDSANLEAASIARASTWRTWFWSAPPRTSMIDAVWLDEQVKPWEELFWWEGRTFDTWRDNILKSISYDEVRKLAEILLSVLDPSKDLDTLELPNTKNKLIAVSWHVVDLPTQRDDRAKELAMSLIQLACPKEDTSYSRLVLPFIVRGILRNGRIKATGAHSRLVEDALLKGKSNLAECPGVKGFTEEDWMYLHWLVRQATRPPSGT